MAALLAIIRTCVITLYVIFTYTPVLFPRPPGVLLYHPCFTTAVSVSARLADNKQPEHLCCLSSSSFPSLAQIAPLVFEVD